MPNASTGQPYGCPVFLLTAREVEALTLAAHGQTIRAIAGRMAIAERTVKAHLYACRRKLAALNTTHAVAIAATRRLINVDTFSSGNDACVEEPDS